MSMEIINLIALIVVPIAAVYIGQKLQDREQKRKDKIQIFKILMTSRIFGWTNDSVQAMNLIDVVFADDKDVCDQWKVCFDKMRIENPTETDLLKMKTEKEKLLEKMAKSLGYKNITWESIQNPYMPKGMVDLMAQQQAFQNSQSMCLLMARPKKVLSVSLPKIWMLRRKFVSTPSCPEPSRFPRR